MYDALNLADPLNRNHPLTAGLAALWLPVPGLDGGKFVYNLCGMNPVTLAGPVWKTSYRQGSYGALSFNGTSDTATFTSVDTSGGLTYSAWVNHTTNAVAFYSILANRKSALVSKGTSLLWFPDTDLTQVTYTVTFTVGQWYHLAVTQSGTSYNLFIDGLSVNSGTTNALDNGTDKNHLGSFGTTWWFPGSIDGAAIHQRALSVAEVFSLYEESKKGYPALLNRHRGGVYVLASAGQTYNQTMSGGALGGGSAAVSVTYRPQASSGALCGSAAVWSVIYAPGVTGGGLCGSAAVCAVIYAPGVTGGGLCASTALVLAMYFPSVSGAGLVGGAADVPGRIQDLTGTVRVKAKLLGTVATEAKLAGSVRLVAKLTGTVRI